MRFPGIPRLILPAVCVALLVATGTAGAQGFGLVKKNVVLVRSVAPAVTLSDARVAIRVTGVGACARSIDDLVRARLVAHVFSNRSLSEDNATPDRVIEVNLTECYSNSQTNQKDGMQLVKGTVRASYRTLDARTKQSVDTANLVADYERRFAVENQKQQRRTGFLGTLDKVGGALAQTDVNQPPTTQELNTILVEDMAMRIARRVVLMEDKMEVPLPRGKLDEASSLGAAGRWGAMLEQLERASPLPGADDAYRLYGIGLASEALAYTETDRSAQRDLIARASVEYGAAMKLKQDEGEFRRAENRIASSLSALDATAAASDAAASASRGTGETSRGAAGGSEWTNAALIELVKAGMKDTELIEAIRAARSVAFDVDSPTGLLQLSRGGVPDTVIRAIRERMKAGAGK